MNIKDLASDQLERVKACKSAEEFAALAGEEGIELTDDQLEALAGGSVVCADGALALADKLALVDKLALADGNAVLGGIKRRPPEATYGEMLVALLL